MPLSDRYCSISLLRFRSGRTTAIRAIAVLTGLCCAPRVIARTQFLPHTGFFFPSFALCCACSCVYAPRAFFTHLALAFCKVDLSVASFCPRAFFTTSVNVISHRFASFLRYPLTRRVLAKIRKQDCFRLIVRVLRDCNRNILRGNTCRACSAATMPNASYIRGYPPPRKSGSPPPRFARSHKQNFCTASLFHAQCLGTL